jgi:hypothetical protein
VIKDIQKKIARGGGTLIAAPIVSGVAAYFGVAVSPEQVASVGQAVGRLYDGGWESAAELIIANIAAAVSAEDFSKMPTGSKEDVFKLENLESKAWIYSNSDGRFGTYRGDDYSDQYWRKIVNV